MSRFDDTDPVWSGVWANGKALGLTDNCIRVLISRYLGRGADDEPLGTPQQLFQRVAHAVAAAEVRYGCTQADVERTEEAYFAMMVEGVFMPSSLTLLNAGFENGLLAGSFVLPLGSSVEEVFDTVKSMAQVLRAGGDVGVALDRLPPTGDERQHHGDIVAGPISVWKMLSTVADVVHHGSFVRGGFLATLKITHADILKFIGAVQEPCFRNREFSVKIMDAWVTAYRNDPEQPHVVTLAHAGNSRFVLPKRLRLDNYDLTDLLPLENFQSMESAARPGVWTMGELLEMVAKSAWQTGAPRLVFIDRVNQFNPTPNVGEMETTDSRGEQPLLPYEACPHGSVNLACFVRLGESGTPAYDWDGLRQTVRLAVRFLENTIDVNHYVLPESQRACTDNRKIGLGIMGFADALFKLHIGYNTPEGVAWGEQFMKCVNDEAHNESERLAEERGVFKNWKGSRWELQWKRRQRHSSCTAVTQTGAVSILAHCSCGIEPLFAPAFVRNRINGQRTAEVNEELRHVAGASNYWGYTEAELFARIASEGSLQRIPAIPDDVKRVFVCARDISPEWHVRMQAVFQRHCDSGVRKTINFPVDASPQDVRRIFNLAYDSGCQGITVYRDQCRGGQPMVSGNAEKTNQ